MTLRSFVGVHFVVTINCKLLVSMQSLKLLQSENTFVSTKAIPYNKHLSMSLITVHDIIIWIILDKLVKTRDVKVSTKRWHDGSQTQRYGGSGTG